MLKCPKNLIICNNTGYLYFNVSFGTYKYKLPAIYFKKGNKFLFISYSFFKSFINNIIYINRKFLYFFFKLKLKGLGFRVRRISEFFIKFFFTCTNFLYLHAPNNLLVKIKKRKLFFLSNDLCTLKNTMVFFCY
jgi:hypothetical protein